MREYVAIVRAIPRGEPPPAAEAADELRPQRDRLYPQLPIYVAALSPAMLRLAGEVADGAMLWLCNPSTSAPSSCPSCGRGVSGPTRREVRRGGAVPSAVVEDPGVAHAAMRRDLLPYFGLPFYRTMLERSGFGDDIAAYDAAAARGDGEGMQAAISERFLDALCAIGTAADVRAGIARYQDAGAAAPDHVGRSAVRGRRARGAAGTTPPRHLARGLVLFVRGRWRPRA